jgi:hypothetical protein
MTTKPPTGLEALRMRLDKTLDARRQEKQQFVDVYDDFGIQFPWSVGDIAIVCNYRFAHGSPSVQQAPGEERELGILFGESYERV